MKVKVKDEGEDESSTKQNEILAKPCLGNSRSVLCFTA